MSSLHRALAGEHLPLSVHTQDLRTELTALCSQYGQLQRLEILSAGRAGRQQVLCVFRMQTLVQDQRLMRALGIGRFGGDLVLVIDLSAPLATQVPALADGVGSEVAASTPAAYRTH